MLFRAQTGLSGRGEDDLMTAFSDLGRPFGKRSSTMSFSNKKRLPNRTPTVFADLSADRRYGEGLRGSAFFEDLHGRRVSEEKEEDNFTTFYRTKEHPNSREKIDEMRMSTSPSGAPRLLGTS